MARRRRRSRRKTGRSLGRPFGMGGIKFVVIAVILLVVAAAAYQRRPQWFEWLETVGQRFNWGSPNFGWLNEPHYAEGDLTVTFIDVGQGDSVFVAGNGQTMLIDAGDRDDWIGPHIVEYIRGRGFGRIDYLVATHPHADHIGGMAEVIRQFDIGEILMPDVQHDTRTFENLIDTVAERGLTVRSPRPGERFTVGGAEVTVLQTAPAGAAGNLNDDSVVMKMRFGEHSFLFTGDAEQAAEMGLVNAGVNISVTVLHVGHHGSATSTTEEFLRAVSPDVAVIQVGAGNVHNHPNRQVLNRLAVHGVTVYRNDIHGKIVITTDGEVMEITTER